MFPMGMGGAPSAPISQVRPDGIAKIKVIGVGGAGNNTINHMVEAGIQNAEFIAVNTDAQALTYVIAEKKVQIGVRRTNGLGAGAIPQIGKEAAEESKEELMKAIDDTDLLFITAGMGGGTGTGAAPVIAKLAREKGILTVAVITKPFEFEGVQRMENALNGIEEIKKYVDTVIVIPNDRIRTIIPANAGVKDALRAADEILLHGIRGIVDAITIPATINLDFADVRTTLKGKGVAHMGVGVARGENRISIAVRNAVTSPLLETTIEGATNVLINITGGNDLTFEDVTEATEAVRKVVAYGANIIVGLCVDVNIQDEVQIVVIATGFPTAEERAEEAAALEREAAAQAEQAPAPSPAYPVYPTMPSAPTRPEVTHAGGYVEEEEEEPRSSRPRSLKDILRGRRG